MSLPVWSEWKTVREIGRGSFGGVYEIQKDIFGDVDKAALKVITIPQSNSDINDLINDGYDSQSITNHYKSYLEDIVREYKLMAELKGCNNIVHCDDLRYTQHEDGIGWDIYIKMELLTPLSKAYKTPVDEQQVIKLGIDMCNALIACKKKNIIHRDIKPQNIFVSEDGTFKLGDFGIAKTAERTTGGTKTGTYKYMAPEVYNNQPYGSSSDLYSLGMVMYWMLNDRRAPFLPLPPAVPTTMSDNEALLRRMNGEKFPAPANGGDSLKSIVMKACEHDPSKRFKSPDAMRNALMSLSSNNSYAGFTTSSAPGKQAPAQINNEGTVGMPWASGERRADNASGIVNVTPNLTLLYEYVISLFKAQHGINLDDDIMAKQRIINILSEKLASLEAGSVVCIRRDNIARGPNGPININFDISLENAQTYEALSPESMDDDLKKEMITMRFENAAICRKNKDYVKELKVLLGILYIDGKNVDAMLQIGRAYRELSRFDRAIEYYNKALDIEPNNPTAHLNMGTIRVVMHDYQRAKGCYEKSLSLIKPGDFLYSTVLANYALAIGKLGDINRAKELLKSAEKYGYQNGGQIRQLLKI